MSFCSHDTTNTIKPHNQPLLVAQLLHKRDLLLLLLLMLLLLLLMLLLLLLFLLLLFLLFLCFAGYGVAVIEFIVLCLVYFVFF